MLAVTLAVAVGGAGRVTAHLGPVQTCTDAIGDTSSQGASASENCQEGKTEKKTFSRQRNLIIKIQN